MHLTTVRSTLPPHRYEQHELIEAFRRFWGRRHHNLDRVEQLHRAVQVGARHLALPMERYERLSGFGDANDAFLEVATAIGAQAVADALEAAGLTPRDVDHFVVASVTGVGAPSVDARIHNVLGMRPDVRRVPIFGLGCVAGAAGLARVSDLVRGWPDHVAVLLCVELCSLTLQPDDLSVPNLIASGLFGDGAAAVVVTGATHPAAARSPLRVVATQSRFYPHTERVMGWDIGDRGFRVVLSAEVPRVVERHIRDDVDAFLAAHGLAIADVDTWVCHPGGPKVLVALEQALGLPRSAFQVTWDVLREVGNLSSASVLFVLERTLAARPVPKGRHAVVLAMGPGFCSELVLLEGT